MCTRAATELLAEQKVHHTWDAVGVAALLEDKPIPGDGPICVVLTGRNIDRDRLEQVLRQGPDRSG